MPSPDIPPHEATVFGLKLGSMVAGFAAGVGRRQ